MRVVHVSQYIGSKCEFGCELCEECGNRRWGIVGVDEGLDAVVEEPVLQLVETNALTI